MSRSDSKRLLALYRRLSEERRHTLLDFAEFLATRDGDQARAPAIPAAIERPPQETVVGAMKRLTATYPMLDPTTLLDACSTLMGEHIVQGRPAAEIIDELEALFRRRYEEHVAALDDGSQQST